MLVTKQEVIANAYSNSSIDESIFKDLYIDIAEQTHVRPALGQDLFDEIVSQNDAGTLTALNTTLLADFIKPSLYFYVKFEVTYENGIQTASLGVRENLDDFSTEVSFAKLAAYRRETFRQATLLKDKMIRFLDENSDDYPLFKCKIGTTFKKSGIFIPK